MPGSARAGDHPFLDALTRYAERIDTINVASGDAQDVNAATQIIDPWPSTARNRRIPVNGQRMHRRDQPLPESQSARRASPDAVPRHPHERKQWKRRFGRRRIGRAITGAPANPLCPLDDPCLAVAPAYRLAMRRSQDIGRLLVIAAAATLLTTIAGCVGDGQPAVGVAAPPPAGPKADDAGTTLTIQNPTDVKYYPSDEPLRLGQEYFDRGIYEVAQQYFQAAVEKAPTDASAWVGLATSYDHIGRFEMADRDYRQAIKLQGERASSIIKDTHICCGAI